MLNWGKWILSANLVSLALQQLRPFDPHLWTQPPALPPVSKSSDLFEDRIIVFSMFKK